MGYSEDIARGSVEFEIPEVVARTSSKDDMMNEFVHRENSLTKRGSIIEVICEKPPRPPPIKVKKSRSLLKCFSM